MQVFVLSIVTGDDVNMTIAHDSPRRVDRYIATTCLLKYAASAHMESEGNYLPLEANTPKIAPALN